MDVYYVDAKAKKEEIDQTLVVRIESFDEELVLENEYDEDSGYGDEDDSNGEKDYPSTEEDYSLESDGSEDDYDRQYRRQERVGAVLHEYDLTEGVDEELLNLYGAYKPRKVKNTSDDDEDDEEEQDSSEGEVYY